MINAIDRIMMFNILKKINSSQALSITEEEQKWLKDNSYFLDKLKKQKEIYKFMENENSPNVGTIEEIICFLDLSHRVIK